MHRVEANTTKSKQVTVKTMSAGNQERGPAEEHGGSLGAGRKSLREHLRELHDDMASSSSRDDEVRPETSLQVWRSLIKLANEMSTLREEQHRVRNETRATHNAGAELRKEIAAVRKQCGDISARLNNDTLKRLEQILQLKNSVKAANVSIGELFEGVEVTDGKVEELRKYVDDGIKKTDAEMTDLLQPIEVMWERCRGKIDKLDEHHTKLHQRSTVEHKALRKDVGNLVLSHARARAKATREKKARLRMKKMLDKLDANK